jgi:hypothetical protein
MRDATHHAARGVSPGVQRTGPCLVQAGARLCERCNRAGGFRRALSHTGRCDGALKRKQEKESENEQKKS